MPRLHLGKLATPWPSPGRGARPASQQPCFPQPRLSIQKGRAKSCAQAYRQFGSLVCEPWINFDSM